MLIINRFKINTPAPVVATNDNVLATGITGQRWGGVNPNTDTGATGNAAAGNGLTYVVTNGVFEKQLITQLIQVTFSGTLTAGQPNYAKIPLVNLGVQGVKVVYGLTAIGVYDPNATNTGVNPTPSVLPATGLTLTIVKDHLNLKILQANLALYQNKVLNVLIYYSNQ